ncbi:MAG: sigma-54-dependent Fis family transcriptional regulator [Rhodospirillales bacterium]|nr:sigma-54-dependent Fis family transcriptional regulator [Rhodospirillales bacterium]
MARVLIVDDDDGLRESLTEALLELGHTAEAAPNGSSGLARIRKGGLDAVLLDLRMPEMDGIALLRALEGVEAPPIAVLTAVPTAANTIEAIRLGAFDHLAKPVGRAALQALIGRMLALPAARTGAIPKAMHEEIVAISESMRDVMKAIGRLADSPTTVLITGETGTGKEIVARAIHRYGSRSDRAFVAVNCAAIPVGLLESELFGHRRGAFTGAVADAAGSIRSADGGTLFLDEIGDMDAVMQAKLLRVLETREVVPVGGNRAVAVDVRFIAATHQALAQRVAEGKFREDLYYRLSVVPLHLPPLRERAADILPLAERFLGHGRTLSAGATARLTTYAWPGNVRELRNAIDRAATLVPGNMIEAYDLDFLGDAGQVRAPEPKTLAEEIAMLEARLIREALEAARGNRTEAARRLGIHRQLLYEKLRRASP